jgi:hypothetical protein
MDESVSSSCSRLWLRALEFIQVPLRDIEVPALLLDASPLVRLTAGTGTAGQPSHSTGITESSISTPASDIAGLLNRVATAAAKTPNVGGNRYAKMMIGMKKSAVNALGIVPSTTTSPPTRRMAA